MIGWGHVTEALIPVSGFPLRCWIVSGGGNHSRVSGLGNRVSGTGLQVRVRVRAWTCTWCWTPEPGTWRLRPGTWELIPVSGFPLS